MLPERSGSEVEPKIDSTSLTSLWLYLFLSLIVGLALCLITPPFFVPDEASHSLRSIQLSHGVLHSQRNGDDYGGWMDSGVVQAVVQMVAIESAIGQQYPIAHDRPNGRMSEGQVDVIRRLHWTGTPAFIGFQNTAAYPPFLYLPQALGWRLGEATGMTVVHSLLLARVLNLLVATGLGCLALLLCVSGRWLVWACLLVPTGLGLRASCSQDALLLTLTAVAGVLLSRAIVARRLLTIPELIWATLLLAMIIPARIPYLPMALVLVLPAMNLRKLLPGSLRAPLLGVLFIFGTTGLWQAVNRIPTFSAPGARPAEQERYIRTHPIAAGFHIVEGTARAMPGVAIKGLELLGMNDVFPPAIVYAGLLVALIGIALLAPCEGLSDRRAWLFLLALLLVVIAGMSVAEYIIWNPPGSAKVEGLQSRYYLALVPFAFLLINRAKKLAESTRRSRGLFGAVILFAILVLYTPWVVSRSYFRTNPVVAFEASLR
jgi:uncharacterized membrane protein